MTKLPQPRRLAVLMCALGLGSLAAPTLADVQYKFSGFGTLGGVKTNTDETEFRTSVEQYRGAGKTIDLGVDSKLAFQGSAVFNNGVTLTAQVLGARKGEDFDMGFEWLFAQYTGIDGLDLKAGRVVLPAFLVSDSRLVGYSTPWLRVPPLVYNMMPMSNIDGGQATYRKSVGSAVASLQMTAGSSKGNSATMQSVSVPSVTIPSVGTFGPWGPFYIQNRGESETTRIFGINAMLEWGDWTFRASQITDHTLLNITFSMPPLAPLTSTESPQSAQLEFRDKFQEFGIQYDNGSLVVMAEHVKRSTKDIQVQAAKSWYVAAGYRFSSVMPYAIISRYKESFSISGETPPATTGRALGLRYELASNMSLKGEFAQYKNSSTYVFTDPITPSAANKKINVMSVALDFIF